MPNVSGRIYNHSNRMRGEARGAGRPPYCLTRAVLIIPRRSQGA